MERFRALRSGLWRYGLAALGVACVMSQGGCSIDDRLVKVHDGAVPPNGPVIATFEKGTGQPDDARFEPFQFYAFGESPDSALNSPIPSPGHNSNFALGLNWRLIDAPNGSRDFPGAGVRTLVNGGIDLSSYSRIVFAQRYDKTPSGIPPWDAGACRPVTGLTVSVGCNEHNTSFEKTVALSTDWTTSTLAFADFAEPSYRSATGTTVEDCLKVADSIIFQISTSLLDGECATGGLLLDDISIRPPDADAGTDGSSSAGIKLVPDADGHFDGSNAAGVAGSWWAGGDYFAFDGTAGGGPCPMAGFPMSACSLLITPTPGTPFRPDANGRMCTSGIAAQVAAGSDGTPAWSSIFGNLVGFELANPGSEPRPTGPQAYDAIAHGLTGFAFDIDAVPTGGHLRVEFAGTSTELDPPYWEGGFADLSPINTPGHYEMRWSEIGGPMYLGPSAPAFDPAQLKWIQIHVVSTDNAPVPYSFCLSNVTLLTN